MTDGAPTILQVLPRLETGGVERGTVDITAAIVEAGWRAVVVSGGGRLVRALARAGGFHVTLPVFSKSPLVMRANAKRLTALMRESLAAIEQGKDPLCIIRDPAKQVIDFPQKSSMMEQKRADANYALPTAEAIEASTVQP